MELLRSLEAKARGRLQEAYADYYAGGAGDEQTLAENAAAWRKLWIRPRVMVDVSTVDTTCTLLGQRLALPLLLAPVAAARLLHPEGELAAARAAGGAGTVYCLSTRATTDLAQVAACATGPLWFQLYADRDRARCERILARVAEHGFKALLLTVDFPVSARRERELRHDDVPLPPGVALASHLGEQLTGDTKPVGGWNASLTWDDIAWIRDACGLPVVVKGVLTAQDAQLALQAGAEGIVVSNHGGRQLDGAIPTAVALPEVAAAVAGRAPVLVDGGIRDGADVLRALALGADAVLIGRPYVWGLDAAGETGVRRVIDAFAQDLSRVLALTGCPALADVSPDHLRAAP